MARAQFSIGIDLGTTNCAMAFEALDTELPKSELFLIPQWETLGKIFRGFDFALVSLPSLGRRSPANVAEKVFDEGSG